MEHSKSVLLRRSDSGLLAKCAQSCAQRRSQTVHALTAGGLRVSSHVPGKLSAVQGPMPSANAGDADVAGFREASSSTRWTAEAQTASSSEESRAAAANCHHQMMRMLASEQRKLPPAPRRDRNFVRRFRMDSAAQVLFLAQLSVHLSIVWR